MKRIGYVSADADLFSLMAQQLTNAPPGTEGKEEMAQALAALASGEYTLLLMETQQEETTPLPSDVLQCGGLTINPKSRRVTRDGEKIDLTPKEFDILYFLASHRGEAFTREQIYNAVWEGEFAQGDNNIMTFIRRLRKKIEVHPDDPQYILTVWGNGYKFNEDI